MTDYEDLEDIAIDLLLKSSLMMLLAAEEEKQQKQKSLSDEGPAVKRMRLPIAIPTEKSKSVFKRKERRLWVEKWREEKQSRGCLTMWSEKSGLSYRNYIRMDEYSFNEILSYIADDIRRQNTVMRAPVSPEEKLSITLRFLATGESFNALNFETGYSNKFLSDAVMEVCNAICTRMENIYIKFPDTKADWLQIANKFSSRWEFPHCLGALDCKHIQFIAPKRERDSLFVEKSYNSVTLLALADSDCKFIFVDIGRYGPLDDTEVLERPPIIHIIRQGQLFLPSDATLGHDRVLPYVIIADNAFPLERHLMTPFSSTSDKPLEQIFNARLSHARQCADRAFGILCNRFRVLQTKIFLNHHKVKSLALCCCILHNFLMEKCIWYREQVLSQDEKDAMALLEVTLRKKPPELTIHGKPAESIRNTFGEYFMNEGSVPWQTNYVEMREVTSFLS